MFLSLNIIFWLLALLIIYPYLLHPLVLLLIHPRRELHLKKDENYLPTVSLIIAVYNEEKILRERLANLRQLDYPPDKLEVIFGLDGL